MQRQTLGLRRLRSLTARWEVRLILLVGIVVGLSYGIWGHELKGLPSVAQLLEAASVAGYLLLIAAGAGVAAMATVQVWKALFLPRAAFHAGELELLFGETLSQVFGLATPTPDDTKYKPESGQSRKPKSLEHLLDNPTEIVMGQIRSAADYIMLRPKGFEEALRRLAGDAGEVAVEAYLSPSKREQQNVPLDSTVRSNDSLTEVRFFVEQHLNLIHVQLRERWRRRIRAVAVAVAGSTGLLTVTLARLGPMATVSAIFAAAIWGGFFS